MEQNATIKTTVMLILSLAFFFILFLTTHLIFVFFSAFFIGKKIREYEATNKWIEEKAKELGLSVCYVNVGGENERKKRVCDKR